MWTPVAIWASLSQPGISQEQWRWRQQLPQHRAGSSPRDPARGAELTSFHSLLPEPCTKRTTTAERGAELGCHAVPCPCHAVPPAQPHHPPGSDLEKVSMSSRFLGDEARHEPPCAPPTQPSKGSPCPPPRPITGRHHGCASTQGREPQHLRGTRWLPLRGLGGQWGKQGVASPVLTVIEHDREPI